MSSWGDMNKRVSTPDKPQMTDKKSTNSSLVNDFIGVSCRSIGGSEAAEITHASTGDFLMKAVPLELAVQGEGSPLDSVLSQVTVYCLLLSLGKGLENPRAESYEPPSLVAGEKVPLWWRQPYNHQPVDRRGPESLWGGVHWLPHPAGQQGRGGDRLGRACVR